MGDDEQVARTANVTATRTSFEESQCKMLQAEHVHAENMRDCSQNEEAVQEVEWAASECFLERDAILSKQERVKTVQKDCFVPLKEGLGETQPQVKKKNNSLVSLGKSMQLDASLLQAFPGVLAKVPSERGPFDLVILEQFEAAFSKHVTEVTDQLQALSPVLEKHELAVQAAKDLLAQAQEKCRASEENVNALSARNLECEETLQSAERALESLEPEFQAVVATRYVAMEQLANFQSTRLAPLRELKGRTRESTHCKDELGPNGVISERIVG